MSKTFYITTPIYYPSGNLHIGNSYTTVFCDAMARYKKGKGFDTRYLTGMDEHGQKIETVAKGLGKTPQEHVNYIAEETKKLWEMLQIDYDDFIRTTEQRHKTVVKKIFEQLLEQDDIYLGEYEGYYCMPDESFFTETQLGEDKTCPDCGRPVELVKEESYFLRLSKYQDRLLKYIEDHPDFITPEQRKNEVVSFIKQGLNDISVSRNSFDWGVKVVSNPAHVVYVWIDALSNYITALGYNSQDESLYEKYWKGDEVVHVVGKDILRFHAIYWPIMLMALDLPISFKLYAHGWYMMKDGKMSKSKGQVIYPEQLIKRYGLDAVRYYLFVNRVNYDLANDFGNLLNRTITMANKYFDSKLEKPKKQFSEFDSLLEHAIAETVKSYDEHMDELQISLALQDVFTLISRSNKYIDETAPWVLAKDVKKKDELNSVLYHLVESLRIIGIMLSPIMLESSKQLFKQLNIPKSLEDFETRSYGYIEHIKVVDKPTPIFPRLEKKDEESYISSLLNQRVEEKVVEEDFATIEDFMKLDFVVGEIVESKVHPDADKLLVSQIDTGDKIRQIVSGISKYYKPEELIGKKVVVVKNLKPVKLRGVLSEGMILAGKNSKYLEILEVSMLNIGDKIS